MSKCLNEIDIKELIDEIISHEYNEFKDDYANEHGMRFDVVGELNKYDERECAQAFADSFDVDFFITEVLQENQDFRDKINEAVDELRC
jgi:hypothetical protein